MEPVSCDGSDIFDDGISVGIDVTDEIVDCDVNGVCDPIDSDVDVVVVGEVAVSLDDETREGENVVIGVKSIVDEGDESDFDEVVVDESVEIFVSDVICVDIEVDNGDD